MAKDKKLTDSDKATYLRSALKSKEAIQIITSQHGVVDYGEMVTALKRQKNYQHFRSTKLSIACKQNTISFKLSSVFDSSKTVPLKAALLEGITAELLSAEISGVKELPCFHDFNLLFCL